MNETYIGVNGWRVRYTSVGTQGVPLILLHGLGSSLESWWYNLDALGQHFRVYAPDMLYFGKTDKPERAPGANTFTEFVRGFMDALGLEEAVLVGHSMGGAVATGAALEYPERVRGLVLVNAAGFGQQLAWWLRARSVAMLNFKPSGKPPAWMIHFALGRLFYDPRRVGSDFLDALIEVAQTPGLGRAYQRVLQFGVDWRGVKPRVLEQVRDQAHRIMLPTLVIWGRQDRVVPAAHAHVIGGKIPHAQVHILDECGHAPMIEHPERFNTLVTTFVREQMVQAS